MHTVSRSWAASSGGGGGGARATEAGCRGRTDGGTDRRHAGVSSWRRRRRRRGKEGGREGRWRGMEVMIVVLVEGGRERGRGRRCSADGLNRGARLAVALRCGVHMSLHLQQGRAPAPPRRVDRQAVIPVLSPVHRGPIHLPESPLPHNFPCPLRNRRCSVGRIAPVWLGPFQARIA